jgi:hypothetical protein
MLKIPADAYPFVEDFERRSGGAGETIAECDAIVHPIANGLNSLPCPRQSTEHSSRNIRQEVDLAITASQKVDEGFFRKVLDRHFRE